MTTTTVTAPRRTDHVAAIDGVRGIAALYVVFHHAWQFAITDNRRPVPGWFKPMNVFEFGSTAVAVFLVVSGWCLMAPVLRHDTTLVGGRPEFGRRRSRRILPPYFAALVVSWLAIAAIPSLRSPTGTPWDITHPSFSVGNVTSHLILVHNWSLEWRYAFNPPMWSIALEFQVYFLFALVLLPIWRRWGALAVTGTAVLLTVAVSAIGGAFAAPWLTILFTMGMGGAYVANRLGVDPRTRAAPWPAVAIAAVIAAPIVVATSDGLPTAAWAQGARDLAVGTAAAAVLIAAATAEDRFGPVVRALSSGPVRRLGMVSYSLYLLHYPLVAAIAVLVVRPLDVGVPASFALIALICVPASIALAIAFFRLVERRFLNTAVVIDAGPSTRLPKKFPVR